MSQPQGVGYLFSQADGLIEVGFRIRKSLFKYCKKKRSGVPSERKSQGCIRHDPASGGWATFLPGLWPFFSRFAHPVDEPHKICEPFWRSFRKQIIGWT